MQATRVVSLFASNSVQLHQLEHSCSSHHGGSRCVEGHGAGGGDVNRGLDTGEGEEGQEGEGTFTSVLA